MHSANNYSFFTGKVKALMMMLFFFAAGFTAFAQVPANDEPCNATPLTLTATCNYTTYTNANATATAGVPAPGCGGYSGGDVWFTIVVPASGSVNIDTQTGVITDGGMAIYSGTCAALTLIECDDDDSQNGAMPSITRSGLTPGSTIWVRVWEFGNNNNGTFGICTTLPAAVPGNDEPCNATAIVPGTTCNYTTYTNAMATGSTGVPAPGCANYAGGDVWFSVVVPAGGTLIFDSQTGVITDGGMAIYSGTCTNLTLIECDDDDSPNGNMPSITRSGLTPGSTVWIRFWEYGGDGNGTFGLCVSLPPAPPVNDDPCVATPLTVNTTCTYTNYTNAGATASTGVPAPGCAGYSGGDVWFSVVVPAGGAISVDTREGVMTDGGMALYSGTCTALTLLTCDDNASSNGNMPKIVASGLTPGATIWIRVWENGNNANGTFGICVSIPPPPPANDNPCTATPLTAAATCTYTTYTTEAATGTTGVPAPGCANYAGGDVWFSVIVPAGGAISIDTDDGIITDGGMALYSGTCTALTLLACDDDGSPNGAMPKLTASGLTPGSTIWVRFWEYGGDNPGTFGICATIPPPPPANDNPCGAITLVANENCTYATYTTEAATGTTGVPAPGCASYAGGDVWFKVVVPCTGSLIVDTEEGQITDGGMALYSGASCTGPLTLLACDDDGSGNGAMPRIVQTGLTPGSTVWIRVWEYGGDNPGTFGICVKIPTPPGPGGTCSTALAFCSSNVYSFPNTTGQPSLGGNGIYGCLGSTPNPTWYYMQVQTGGNITIGITQVDANGDELDVDFALWGPFNSLAGSCGGLTAANNISCSFSPSYTETAQINNAQAGQFYILLLTNYSDDPGTITFQQTGGTGSTNCNLVCNVTAANSGPVCPRALFNLTSSTVPNGVYSWTGPNCFTSTQQNPTGVVAPSTPGTYVYTVSVTGPNGVSCVSTTTVTVLQGPALGADSTVTRCAGSSLNLTTLYTTTGNTTAWTIGGQPVANPAAVTVGGVYQLVATNTIGCTDTALVTFRLDTVRAVATPANGTCTTNGTITISDTVGIRPFTFSISTNPGVFQSSPVFNVPPAAYTITVRDSLGCTASVPVTVGFNNTLFISGRPDTTICPGGSAVLTTTSNATSYSWSPTTGLSNPAIASPVATPTVTTRYILTAGLGVCTRTDTVNINVVSSVNVNAGPDITILNGDAINLNATTTGPVTNILWSPATGLSATNILNPLANPTATTQYTITVNDAIGCTDSDDLLITVINNCIKVKNAFTPNGDGNNDLWQVYDNFGCLRNVTVHIYNRYGNRVYESRDYRNQWDGTYQGKPVPDATYYAVIDFTLITGRVLTVKSDVTILR